jgi:muramidase (phage lysozyme)
MPKIGPWRPLDFKRLTPEIEKMYMASFNATIERYRQLLAEQRAGHLTLPNENLDVGAFTAAGKYQLTDRAYSQLLHKLQGRYTEIPQELRSDILAFYQDPNSPISTKTSHGDWARVLRELDQLRAVNMDLARDGSSRELDLSAGAGAPPRP